MCKVKLFFKISFSCVLKSRRAEVSNSKHHNTQPEGGYPKSRYKYSIFFNKTYLHVRYNVNDFIDKYKIIFKNKYNKEYTFSKFKFDIPIIYFNKDEIIENICEKIIDEKLEYSAYFKLKHKIEINNIYYLEYIWEYRDRCKSKEKFDDMTDSHSFTLIISLENLCIMWDRCA